MAVGPTRGKERLGILVRSYMDREKLSVEDVRKKARVSRDTVYNLTSGGNRPRWPNFMAILTAIGVTADELAVLVALWEVADEEKIRVEFVDDLGPTYLRFRRWETDAVEERTIDTYYMPGIFQTSAYAEALAASAPHLIRRKSWKDIAAAERRERSSLLHTDEPLTVHSLIDESVLLRAVGGRDVLMEQLARLLEFGALPNVNIRILPLSGGGHGVHGGGGVTLLRFRETDSKIEGWVDTSEGLSALREDRVQAYSDVWDAAVKRALSVQESADLIRKVRGNHK